MVKTKLNREISPKNDSLYGRSTNTVLMRLHTHRPHHVTQWKYCTCFAIREHYRDERFVFLKKRIRHYSEKSKFDPKFRSRTVSNSQIRRSHS